MRIVSGVALIATLALGIDGVGNWGEMCMNGQRQSPIDIDGFRNQEEQVTVSPANSTYVPLSLHYPGIDTTYTSHQSGSAYLLTHLQGGFTGVPVGGSRPIRYTLERVEFRTPAEHRLGSREYELEMQMMHRGEDGSRAGVAVWYQRSEVRSELLDAIIQDTPLSFQRELGASIPDYHLYSGSQTLPPCTEDISWFLLGAKPASLSQLSFFTHMWSHSNARPLQLRNGRFVYHFVPSDTQKFLSVSENLST